MMEQIAFTDEELKEIEAEGGEELNRISTDRDKALVDLHTKQRRIVADLDYITSHRITLLRTGSMAPEVLKADEDRLNEELNLVNAAMVGYAESAHEMLKYVITFSELVKNASQYYEYALDSERQELVTEVFSELVFKDKKLVKYGAKDGFAALLARNVVTGSPVSMFSELHRIYAAVVLSMGRVEKLPYLRAAPNPTV
jgi:hypothetical protein